MLAAGVAACGGDDGATEATPEPPLASDASLPESVEAVPLVPLGGADVPEDKGNDGGDGDELPGEPALLGDLLGDRPIVLNFFASWCAPCIEEMPRFEALHQEMGDRVTFLGMAEVDGEERALDVVKTTGVTYPTYNDPNGDVLTFFEGTQMPTTVFISPSGDVRETHSGELSEKELRGKIEQHFDVASPGSTRSQPSGAEE